MINESIRKQLLSEAHAYAHDTYIPYEREILSDEELEVKFGIVSPEIILVDSKLTNDETEELVNAKVLLVVEELTDNICLAARNLGNVKIVLPEEVNTYDVVNSDKMVVTAAALTKLEEVLGNE